jgi:FkbM family methyltransferase
MNARQFLLPVYRSLRPVVDTLHLNAFARPVWAALWRSSERKLIRARQNDRTWWLDPNVALGGEYYEAATVGWLRGVIKPGMTVVDIGANVGQLSLEMAQLVGPSGKVISVEPSPGNLRFLRAHISANGFDDRVTILEAACCALESGELTLEVVGRDPNSIENGPQLTGLGLQRNPIDKEQPRTQVKVQALSLDALCRKLDLKVDVLKVDVEGAELEVFRGARAGLARFKPRIIFGFHPFAFADSETARRELEDIFGAAGLMVENSSRHEHWALQEYTVRPR